MELSAKNWLIICFIINFFYNGYSIQNSTSVIKNTSVSKNGFSAQNQNNRIGSTKMKSTALPMKNRFPTPLMKKKRPNDSRVKSPNCKIAHNRGTNCSNGTKSIKWHLDVDTMQCLPFTYNGCGGNANRFNTKPDCKKNCLKSKPLDSGSCSGQIPPANDATGQTIVCQNKKGPVAKCPNGYRCQMFFGFGLCCHSASADMYDRNFNPKCANGKPVHSVLDPINNWNDTYSGKCCADEFCPLNTNCIQQELFAHCCPK